MPLISVALFVVLGGAGVAASFALVCVAPRTATIEPRAQPTSNLDQVDQVRALPRTAGRVHS